MRKLAVAILLFHCAVAAASPVLYGTRSDRYEMQVSVTLLSGDQVRYNVKVMDAAGNVLAVPVLTATRENTAEIREAAGDLTLLVGVGPYRDTFSASLTVRRGDTVIDQFRSGWTLSGAGAEGGPYRVGGDVRAPVVINRVDPVPTAEARAARIAGIVIVEALIDRTGAVRQVRVLKPLPFGLDVAAVEALEQWKFAPATRNGEPVDVLFNLKLSFNRD